MVFKLVEAAQKTWRRLDGNNQLPKLILDVKFADGLEVAAKPANREPATVAATLRQDRTDGHFSAHGMPDRLSLLSHAPTEEASHVLDGSESRTAPCPQNAGRRPTRYQRGSACRGAWLLGPNGRRSRTCRARNGGDGDQECAPRPDNHG